MKDFAGSGITNQQAYAVVAAHESGHQVHCDHPSWVDEAFENAFKIKYVGDAASATLNKTVGAAFKPIYLKTTVSGAGDLDYNLRSTSYDTLQELVDDIHAKADYDASLNGTGAQPSIPLRWYDDWSLPKNSDEQLQNFIDDFIMCEGFSSDSAKHLKFNQIWGWSVPAMNIADHY